MKPIDELQVTVVGGDARQIIVAEALVSLFKSVKIFGHPRPVVPQTIEYHCNLVDALVDADIILLPIGGMNDQGLVWSYKGEPLIDFGQYLTSLKAETLIVTGAMTKHWLDLANTNHLKVIQYADDDEIAILNSIPTAEGTLQYAMEELPITIHGSEVVVIGFGRVGMSVARVFMALNAEVTITARRKESLARAKEMGCNTILLEQWVKIAQRADLIINTVPALIIDDQILANLKPRTVIIDLASAPGGTDFKAAERRQIKAILAPGLPGLVAPKTAGDILASTIPWMIQDYFKERGGASEV
ncbi:MAG TPA: dipicolinate synthase subunit DpsA [Bacillota bacterium]|nr:dipicolinate synthase subunit DpsA [Bacillota bacterium]